MRSGVGRGPALAALLAAEPADPEEGVLLHGLAPTTVVATPVLHSSRDAGSAAGRRVRRGLDARPPPSPCCSVAQRPRFHLAPVGWPRGRFPACSCSRCPTRSRPESVPAATRTSTARSVGWRSASIGWTWVLFVLLRSGVESIEHQIFHLVTPGGLPRGLPTNLSRPAADYKT
jgi:hypothetical protein